MENLTIELEPTSGVTRKRRKLILFVFGTRPEAIKLAPVIQAFQNDGELEVRVCVTGQHRQLLDQVLDYFQIEPDIDLDLMTPDQSLPALASKVIASCGRVFEQMKPDLVFVQGDTTSAFAAAFAAGLCRIPVAHVEAGLRSDDKSSPFPEEINRVLTGKIAELHFAPSQLAARNLRREGIVENVHVVGNSVVDTLRSMLRTLGESGDRALLEKFSAVYTRRKIVLVTLHRRESFGLPMANICGAIRDIAEHCPEVEIIIPLHPNRRAREVITKALAGIPNVNLLEPLSYAECIWLQCRASLVITDSGGILEEAVTLGIPVLVVRDVTERVEAIAANQAQLLGSDRPRIFAAARAALGCAPPQNRIGSALRNTFGDGRTAERIVRLSKEHLMQEGPMQIAMQTS